MSPSSGSSTIVSPRFTLRPPMVASRTASVTASDGRDTEVAKDRRQAVARGDGDDGERQPPVRRRANRHDPVTGERRGPRLPHVAGLVIEVLDADPAQRAKRQAVANDLVRVLA